MRTEFLCVSVLRAASGPRVKLASCKSGSGMKPTDRNPVTETRHRDQNFYPGLQD